MRFVGADLGSYWASAQLLDPSGQPIGDVSTLHYERVLSHEQATAQRTLPRPRRVLLALPSVVRPRERKLCFVTGGTSMDGQMRLWLDLIAALQQHPTTKYSFHMFRVQAPTAVRLDPYLALGIPITYVHLTVDSNNVAKYNLTNNKTMAQLAAYAKGLGRHPAYVARLFGQYTAALSPCRGAILVYANSQDHGDSALSLVARHVQVQAVVLELSGLRPMPHAVDAVIGPSQFAVYHESVAQAVAATHRHVIVPGVNTTLFVPAAKPKPNDCLVVGYLGRIAPEKSLGLLARATELLTAKHDLCLVFRWVGEGPDAVFYQHYPVELLGGIYNETALVHELQSWDLAVHPGLRETFGIANIEVMALAVLWLHVTGASLNETARLRFLWPPPRYLLEDPKVPITFALDGPKTNGYIRFSSAKLDGMIDIHTPEVAIMDIEPGTHWITAEALTTTLRPIGPPAVLQIERILSRSELYRDAVQAKTTVLALPAVAAARPATRRLCFVASATPMDGQKRIWLRLMASLRRHPTTAYSFHIFILEHKSPSRPNVFSPEGLPVTYAPMTVTEETARQYNLTSNVTMGQLAKFATSNDKAHLPTYLHELWATYLTTFAPCKGAVLVFANSRDYGDTVLAHVGRAIGAAGVVLELSSVFPMPNTVDVLLSPSQYALSHPSVVTAVDATLPLVVPPGVDPTLFAPAASAPYNDCIVVGYLGRIAPEKSLGLLARAIELLVAIDQGRCLAFRWVGDGADTAHYKQYPITLLGTILDEATLVHELQSWDLAVHMGLRETYGIANVEVMAVGIPLVCFGVAGLTEYVRHDENAWVVDEVSPDALANAIHKLANDPSLRQRLGHGARQTIEKRFTWAQTVAAYDEVYGRLVAKAARKMTTNTSS
ncbi:hypothetical protein SDRG_10367 [Saprolegnia diclina VS20]|uniref:Glycosyl transferase family 1 domain-containing protein n=1 Tax=Saprolegnia diclina (strain VS20) TaxID=1156394 RepID=T0RIJ4_SAPDV|nr:hypothetical protein SDRG_10367 [Saprolegnia diclina VS20]EQC32173.1 hypothetical protein SDRG_10367 [Saprolegnia diclina VS20]|eukprot:XP_008614575.1 hypothetical protein SDRG_10367 [Saprolegnia diclina VS20]